MSGTNARALQAKDKRIAELERETRRLQGYIDVAHSERDAAWKERDEARRALDEERAKHAGPSEDVRASGAGSTPAQVVPASPAPIPLGAPRRWLLVVDAEGIAHECAESNEMEQALRDLRDVERTYHEKGRVVPVIEAVADAATVERVALRVKQYNGPTAVSAEGFARIILEELGYTIQEGEA